MIDPRVVRRMVVLCGAFWGVFGVVGGGGDLHAQVNTLVMSSAVATPGSSVTLTASLENMDPIDGMSFGVCFDPAGLTLIDALPASDLTSVGPSFLLVELYPDGLTLAAVIDFVFAQTLPAGVHDLLNIQFSLTAPPGTVEPVEFCDYTRPDGITVMRILVSQAIEIVPSQQNGQVASIGVVPEFVYSLDDPSVEFSPALGTPSAVVTASIEELASGLPAPTDTYGFSISIGHDPQFITAIQVGPAGALTSVGGTGPDFFGAALHVDGVTAGVVYGLGGLTTLAFPVAAPVLTVEYALAPGNPLGLTVPFLVPVSWVDGLGLPPVDNLVVTSAGGGVVTPSTIDGSVAFIPVGSDFVRGDCVGDGTVNIGDPVSILGYLFGATGEPGCLPACDANQNEIVDLADPIYLLNFLFLGGPPPPSPFPICGPGIVGGPLFCNEFDSCP